ncbi:MAG: peptide ABC transporter substrate-binding protein [Chloroflexia bacterium]|nr:peptide ABC transporter substrate-binding protein [Chloroflexia bacterium]
MAHQYPLQHLVGQLRHGDLSRRQFMQAATALGIGTATASLLASGAASQEASPAASPEAATAVAPAAGTEGQERGAGGDLRIIQAQAPTVLAAHSATGSKDSFAGNLVMEPLLGYQQDGSLHPILAASVPSVEDGSVAQDLTSVTFTLREGVTWSDGEPFTANDVIFTWQWVTNPDNASVNIDTWAVIASIEAPDDLTAVATFTGPQVAWFEAFTGSDWGIIYPAHVFGNDPANLNEAFLSTPVGTGPFKVDSFAPNDAAQFSANENYREPNKPFFASVSFKGGGDEISAGRAVVQTGEYDYAWNVQAEPEIIEQLRSSGDQGKILQNVNTTVESFYLNFSDPNAEVDGERSHKDTPHPFLTDAAVRQALNLAINRELISEEFYGDGELAEANVLAGNPFFTSPNTSWEFNLEAAAQMLDDAGWTLDGDTRAKDGVELSLTYATPINQVRQKTQAVVKADLESIGIAVELVQVDPGIFFDGAAGNDQNFQHFYWDLATISSGPSSAVPVSFVNKWYAGENGENISQQSNSWTAPNIQRWQSPEFDALYEELLVATTLEEASRILIAINDLVIGEVVCIPIVLRPFYNAVSNRLREENVGNDNGFASPYWNIANWNLAEA